MSKEKLEALKALVRDGAAPEVKTHLVSPVQTLVVQYASVNVERPVFTDERVKTNIGK